MKICSKCLIEQPEDEFSIKTQSRKQTRCRTCTKQVAKEHYKKNRQEYIQRSKERRIKLQEFIQSLKNKPCADCEQSFPYFVMDFDHREDKEFNLFTAPGRGFSFKKVLEEVKKCDIVCANCHRLRTFAHLKI